MKSVNTCLLCALMHCWIRGFKLVFSKSGKVVSSLGNIKGYWYYPPPHDCTVLTNDNLPVFFSLTFSNFPDDIVGQRSVQAVLRSLGTGKAESSVFRLYYTLNYLTVKKMKKMCLFPLRMTCLKRREMVCRPIPFSVFIICSCLIMVFDLFIVELCSL